MSKVKRYDKIVTVHIEDFFDDKALSHILVDDTSGGHEYKRYKSRFIAWLQTLKEEIADRTDNNSTRIAILDPMGLCNNTSLVGFDYYGEDNDLITMQGSRLVNNSAPGWLNTSDRYKKCRIPRPRISIIRTNFDFGYCAEYRVAAVLQGHNEEAFTVQYQSDQMKQYHKSKLPMVSPVIMRQDHLFMAEVLRELGLSEKDISDNPFKDIFSKIYKEMERVLASYNSTRGDANIVKGCTLFDAYCELLFETKSKHEVLVRPIKRWRQIGSILSLTGKEISELKNSKSEIELKKLLSTKLKQKMSSRIQALSSSAANTGATKGGLFGGASANRRVEISTTGSINGPSLQISRV